MKNWRRVLLALALASCCALSPASAANQKWFTAAEIEWVAFFGLHGLWGGSNVWIAGDGTLYRQDSVGRGGPVTHAKGQLDANQLTQFRNTVAQHDASLAKSDPQFAKMMDVGGYGLYVRAKSGRSIYISIYGATDDKNFAAIIEAVQKLKTIEPEKQFYKGAMVDWRPPGFPEKLTD